MQRFENQSVFVEDGAKIAIQLRCDIRVILIEITNMKPMVYASALVDWCDKMSGKNPHSLIAIAIYRNAAGRRSSKVDHGDRWSKKIIIMPTINGAAEFAIVLENSDRGRIENPAPNQNLLTILFGLYGNTFARRVAAGRLI